jgi:hypothetical protein
MPADIDAMLARDEAEWALLTALLDDAGDRVVHEPGSPPWNARDVYAHLARWIGHSVDAFEARLAGREPPPSPPGSDDEINARWQAADSALSFADARGRAHRAYERRLAAVRAAPEERWDNALRATAHADGYQHYESHRRYIETAGSEGG